MFLISLTTALGYSVWQIHFMGPDKAWLDFWDFIVSNNLLPLGAIVMALFCFGAGGGWGWDNFVKEANEGSGIKIQKWMKPLFVYVVPLIVLVIYIVGIVDILQ